MPAPTETKIYRLAGACAILGIVAFVVPRFVPHSEGGFASAASAISVFLLILAVTFAISLYLLTMTLRQYRSLSTSVRMIGMAPSIVFGLALLWLIFFLGY
jgi:hypothetical protein